MRIDLHCHTNRYSACSSLAPEALIARANAAGLDAVCFTEHDRLWPVEETVRLTREHGILVLRGMEVTTEAGHVLVFGLEQPPEGMFFARSLIAAVRAAGGLAVLAHPGRAGQPALAPIEAAALFDAIEVLNGSDGGAQNGASAALALAAGLPGVAGSDCHAPHEVGTVATVLPAAVRDEHELIAALRRGGHTMARMIDDR